MIFFFNFIKHFHFYFGPIFLYLIQNGATVTKPNFPVDRIKILRLFYTKKKNMFTTNFTQKVFIYYYLYFLYKKCKQIRDVLYRCGLISPLSPAPQKYPEHAIYKVLHLMLRRGELQHRMQRKVLYRVK